MLKGIGHVGLVAVLLFGCAGVGESAGEQGVPVEQVSSALCGVGGAGQGATAAQIESQTLIATSTGDQWVENTAAIFSGGKEKILQANEVGDFVTLGLLCHPASALHVVVRTFGTPAGGQFQITTAPNVNGPWTNLGPVVDTFGPGVQPGSVPFKAVDLGAFTFPMMNAYFRFTVVGKNPSSVGYTLSLDSIYYLN